MNVQEKGELYLLHVDDQNLVAFRCEVAEYVDLSLSWRFIIIIVTSVSFTFLMIDLVLCLLALFSKLSLYISRVRNELVTVNLLSVGE